MKGPVRVRFAPSPTGYLHLGNARCALFNWLFARNHNGTFILRIEDTDVERSKEDYVEQIMTDLRWLKLEWDEGPDIGGEFGPYRQSDRFTSYEKYAKELLKAGKAYFCYCTPKELEERRKKALKKGEPPRYDNRCRKLTKAKKEKFEKAGRKPALRFKVPLGRIEVHDLIRGRVLFDSREFGDFVIMKSDGTPTFNFAVVVDDALMKISHVIRGEDHLPNTPKQLLLFEALGFKPPSFAHLAMTLGPSGEMLSKREGANSIAEYRKLGFLPEALVNYMALLGWSPGEDREIMPVEEMAKEFKIEAVSKSAAIFDQEKLNWVSGNYIRRADLDRITSLCLTHLKRGRYLKGEIAEEKYEWLKKIVDAVKDHLRCLSEITEYVDIFFKKEVKVKTKKAKDLLKDVQSKKVLKVLRDELKKVDVLDEASFKLIISELQNETRLKGQVVFMPIRVAMTGKQHGPELARILPILGKDVCLERIDAAFKM